jgi:hypothetical protein
MTPPDVRTERSYPVGYSGCGGLGLRTANQTSERTNDYCGEFWGTSSGHCQ